MTTLAETARAARTALRKAFPGSKIVSALLSEKVVTS
jgi:hypothetical protein